MKPLARHEHVVAASAIFQACGLPFEVDQKGKHIKMKVSLRDGRFKNFICAKTTSDHRSLKNFIGDVRRGLRQCGIEVTA